MSARGIDNRSDAVAPERALGQTPMVAFRKVRKRFGALTVLDDLSFEAAPGEHLALIGPSGSGKTTILRILMTLESVDGGEVLVDGEHLSHEKRGDRSFPPSAAYLHRLRGRIGMVFQHFNLFPHMTALENITLAPVLTGRMNKAAARKRGLELLERVGLADKAHELPNRLSGGQKQRVGIARALALEPKIMLFDEITSALDPELVEEVLNVIARLRAESDMTMLLVTHEMSFARDFADRVLFFDAGRIVEQGTPAEIFIAPQQERTRAFLRKIIAAGQRV